MCGFLDKFGCLEINVWEFVGGYFIVVGVIGGPWCKVGKIVGNNC